MERRRNEALPQSPNTRFRLHGSESAQRCHQQQLMAERKQSFTVAIGQETGPGAVSGIKLAMRVHNLRRSRSTCAKHATITVRVDTVKNPRIDAVK
jgi:hypothetical protein